MPLDDNDLEKYLREFRPRAMRPLETARSVSIPWKGWLAAAALVLFSATGGLWYGRHNSSVPGAGVKPETFKAEARVEQRKTNTILLTKLALEDPKRFEEELEADSRRELPDLQGARSTLRVLTKE